jgi:hypothetical protein
VLLQDGKTRNEEREREKDIENERYEKRMSEKEGNKN